MGDCLAFQHEQALLHRRMLTEKDNDEKLTITLLGTGMIAYPFCRSTRYNKCKERNVMSQNFTCE